MKENKKNIVLVMAAGKGTRFGADKPKQYYVTGGGYYLLSTHSTPADTHRALMIL